MWHTSKIVAIAITFFNHVKLLNRLFQIQKFLLMWNQRMQVKLEIGSKEQCRYFHKLGGKSRRKLFLFSLKDHLHRRRLYFEKSITSIIVELLLGEKRAYYVVLRTRLPFFNRDKRQNLVATKMRQEIYT